MVTKVVINGVAGALPPTGASARAPALVAPPPAPVARASGRPSRARVQQIRELIFAAAMAEFSERGFRGATIASIAERSGVSRMTVYKHAESKEQLLEKLSEFSSERLRMAIESAIDETLPCWEVLMAVGRCLYMEGKYADSRVISRVLVIEAERLPDIVSRGLHLRERSLAPLTDYLGRLALQGTLRIDNPQHSSQQFLNLTTGSVDFLFGDSGMSEDEMQNYVAVAVKTFLYGVYLGRSNPLTTQPAS